MEQQNSSLNPYIPVPGQNIKEYPADVTGFLSGILRSFKIYTKSTREGVDDKGMAFRLGIRE